MPRSAAAVALLLMTVSAAARAEPPGDTSACHARLAAVLETMASLKLSDELQGRVDEELERVRTYCDTARFAEADRAAELALRLARKEPDPE